MKFLTAFGIAVREARRAAHLNQTQLGARAGLHLNFISLIERGKSSPALDSICAIATALAVKPSDLLAHAERLVAADEERGVGDLR